VYLSNEKENRRRIGEGGELDVKEGRAVDISGSSFTLYGLVMTC